MEYKPGFLKCHITDHNRSNIIYYDRIFTIAKGASSPLRSKDVMIGDI